MTAPRLVLLGPQRRRPNLAATLESLPELDLRRGIAVVSAGWEERELEHEELASHVGVPVHNLEVYGRVEEIYVRDPQLRDGMRRRHDRLKTLQELYRLRLDHAIAAARTLLDRDDEPDLVVPERDAAIAAVRELDAHHLERIRAIHAEFEQEFQPGQHALVAQLRDRLRHEAESCAALCVAGGHVAILLNRLRVAGLFEIWDAAKPIVAWGAGAMVLAERVIVFHDSPPQGHGNTEVFEVGFGLARGVVPLPHAQARLDLHVPRRVEMFARRFAPDACFALEAGSRLDCVDGEWRGVSELSRLGADGSLVEVSA